jgi:hypothetical protein
METTRPRFASHDDWGETGRNSPRRGEAATSQGQRTLKMNSGPTKGRFSGHLLII